jgi:hypothetical protein
MGSHVADARVGVVGEVVLDVVGHLVVSDELVGLVHLLHSGLGVHEEDAVEGHARVVVGHGVSFPVAQSARVGVLCEELPPHQHHVGFDVVGVLCYLVVERVAEFLRLRHQRSVHLHHFTQVFFGVVVKRKGAHAQPNHLVSVLCESMHEFDIARMHEILHHEIMNMPTNVAFRCGSVHIADHQFIAVGIEIDLCVDGDLFE